MATTIREFLVNLGFKVDESGLRRFREGVGRATADAKALGNSATVAAAQVIAAVSAIADEYEQLYYTSLRTATSVSTLKSFEYGSRAIGISAEAAAASLETLNLQLKLNPGREALANMLGVRTAGREVKAVYTDLIEVFAKMTRDGGPMGFAVASNYAAQFGISPSEMLRRIQLRKEEADAEAKYAEKLKQSGVNADELAKRSKDYNQQLRDLGASIGLVWDQSANRLLPVMSQTVSWFTEWADYAVRVGKNTDGISSSVLGLVAALASLKGGAAILSALGVAGAGAIGAAAGAGASGLLGLLGLGYSVYPSAAGEGDAEEERRRGGRDARPATQAELMGKTAPAKAAGTSPSRDGIMRYFMAQGWSREAAAGIAANLYSESKFNPRAQGDGGKAYGVAQWHPDRQAAFREWAGKDIRDSSLEEQLAFIHYELTQGRERAAGNKLRGATSAAGAGAIVSSAYERPADRAGEEFRRAALAKQMFDASLTSSPGGSSGGAASIVQNNHINVRANDPQRAAELTGAEVRRANDDLVRNAGVNVR